jgi:hypothetical protein
MDLAAPAASASVPVAHYRKTNFTLAGLEGQLRSPAGPMRRQRAERVAISA